VWHSRGADGAAHTVEERAKAILRIHPGGVYPFHDGGGSGSLPLSAIPRGGIMQAASPQQEPHPG
jgi:hypothetical protein